jgi:hypothetical protein
MCKMWISCAPVSVILVSQYVHSSETKSCLKESHLGIKVAIKNCMKISVNRNYWSRGCRDSELERPCL